MWEGGKGERRRGHRGVIWHRKEEEEEEEVALRVSGVSSFPPYTHCPKREKGIVAKKKGP